MSLSGARPLWTATVLTLFPDMFPGLLSFSLAGKSLNKGLWHLNTVDIREFARDKHRTVDDAPFGGGVGMVMRADVLSEALDFACKRKGANSRIIYLTPKGKRFDQALAEELAEEESIVLICGRYEGIDQRLLDCRPIEEISIGDFVLSGGEPAAIVLMDTIIRLLPGVIKSPGVFEEESFSRGLLEYPQYTRPQNWEGHVVPDILLSGDHENVRSWRLARAEALTRVRRPDLWSRYAVSDKSRG